MDLSLKPSLARYTMRPQQQEMERPTPTATATDLDEALLALLERESQAARYRLRQGQPKQAIEVLRRAFYSAEKHAQDGLKLGGAVPMAARLGRAQVRLQFCAVLSKCGRHPQALGEALTAFAEIHEAWKELSAANIDLEDATLNGDPTKPAATYRKLLTNPPKWFQKVVEVSVQVRLCIALELEFADRTARAQAEVESMAAARAPAADADPSAAPREPTEEEKRQAAARNEMRRLYKEAAAFARQLLPATDGVRIQAEKAEAQALARWGEGEKPKKSPSDVITAVELVEKAQREAEAEKRAARRAAAAQQEEESEEEEDSEEDLQPISEEQGGDEQDNEEEGSGSYEDEGSGSLFSEESEVPATPPPAVPPPELPNLMHFEAHKRLPHIVWHEPQDMSASLGGSVQFGMTFDADKLRDRGIKLPSRAGLGDSQVQSATDLSRPATVSMSTPPGSSQQRRKSVLNGPGDRKPKKGEDNPFAEWLRNGVDPKKRKFDDVQAAVVRGMQVIGRRPQEKGNDISSGLA
eukprot:gnl/TRDRNA2_/TRDRNA2_80279_c0_seq1.p1 gnl/TRDRNA2_/TRDRNA2_80279_c0~~gnl/TRDRNA2_/TRDRNA2_80279_c0_seq1.p1  ORF type:complete len:525 (+),score=118.07 gnl/TRDRNA2_/TRDRNA2_80279_c0_seq1:162-1736(+)